MGEPELVGAVDALASTIAANLSVIDVTAPPYLADRTGVSDATSAITNAINDAIALTHVKLYVPGGRYKVAAALPPIPQSAFVTVAGDSDLSSALIFTPPTDGAACVTGYPLAYSTVDYANVRDLCVVINGTHAGVGFLFIAPANGCNFEGLRVDASGNTNPATVGIRFEGWDQFTLSRSNIRAAHPLVIGAPSLGTLAGGGSYQLDHVAIRDVSLTSVGDAAPLIEIESGVSVSYLTIEGRSAWVGGLDGLLATGTGVINNLEASGVRREGAAGGWFFKLDKASVGGRAAFINCGTGGANAHGYYIRNMRYLEWNRCITGTGWSGEVTLDAQGAGVNSLWFINSAFFAGVGSTKIIDAALELQYSADQNSTTSPFMYSFSYYARRAAIDQQGQINQGQYVGRWTMTLANAAAFSMPTPAFTMGPGILSIVATDSDTGGTGTVHEAGIYSISPWGGAPVRTISTPTGNMLVGAATAGKLSITYVGAGNYLVITNNLGADVTLILTYN